MITAHAGSADTAPRHAKLLLLKRDNEKAKARTPNPRPKSSAQDSLKKPQTIQTQLMIAKSSIRCTASQGLEPIYKSSDVRAFGEVPKLHAETPTPPTFTF